MNKCVNVSSRFFLQIVLYNVRYIRLSHFSGLKTYTWRNCKIIPLSKNDNLHLYFCFFLLGKTPKHLLWNNSLSSSSHTEKRLIRKFHTIWILDYKSHQSLLFPAKSYWQVDIFSCNKFTNQYQLIFPLLLVNKIYY